MSTPKFSTTSLLLLGFSLLGMLIPLASAAGGHAITYNYCGEDIYCAVVEGCRADNPGCDKAVFRTLHTGKGFKTDYDSFKIDTPIAIMYTRQKPDANGEIAGTIAVSQLEINWRPDQGKTWFDVSNVEGKPFKDQGESLYTNEGKTAELDTCAGGTCKPGANDCFAFYDKDNHDRRGMRACSPDAILSWSVCLYDSSLPAYGPLDATVKNLGFLNATVDN